MNFSRRILEDESAKDFFRTRRLPATPLRGFELAWDKERPDDECHTTLTVFARGKYVGHAFQTKNGMWRHFRDLGSGDPALRDFYGLVKTGQEAAEALARAWKRMKKVQEGEDPKDFFRTRNLSSVPQNVKDAVGAAVHQFRRNWSEGFFANEDDMHDYVDDLMAEIGSVVDFGVVRNRNYASAALNAEVDEFLDSNDAPDADTNMDESQEDAKNFFRTRNVQRGKPYTIKLDSSPGWLKIQVPVGSGNGRSTYYNVMRPGFSHAETISKLRDRIEFLVKNRKGYQVGDVFRSKEFGSFRVEDGGIVKRIGA